MRFDVKNKKLCHLTSIASAVTSFAVTDAAAATVLAR
jgi:hypothetical protein